MYVMYDDQSQLNMHNKYPVELILLRLNGIQLPNGHIGQATKNFDRQEFMVSTFDRFYCSSQHVGVEKHIRLQQVLIMLFVAQEMIKHPYWSSFEF